MKKALILSLAGLAASVFTAGSAGAQVTDPDIRNIRPVVMMLLDTSGSMERMPAPNETSLPACTGAPATPLQRNRWTFTVEALTGSWDDTAFYCTTRARSSYPGSPDETYYLPYHEPPLAVPQNNDGILDAYIDRIKFGLMTFDGIYTFTDSHPMLVDRTYFQGRLTDNANAFGGYSYGWQRNLWFPQGGSTSSTAPVCGPYMVDVGARREGSGVVGGMISVGDENADAALINANIQSTILSTRPFGGTPTAGMLDDLHYYLTNHPDVTGDDPFEECRPRFGLLITDGLPDEDFRDARYNCEAAPPPSGGGETCPYDTSDVIAERLISDDLLDGLFVVGLDVNDAAAQSELTLLATAGGTGAALFANDRTTLMQRVGSALDLASPGNTSRSVPTFASSASSFQSGGVTAQYQFNAGFHVGSDDIPWSGVLERTRYECDATTLTPVPEPAATRLRFDQVLNARPAGTRNLLTVLTPSPAGMTGNVTGVVSTFSGGTAAAGTITGEELEAFDGDIDPAYFGLTTSTERDAVVAWVHGDSANRVNNRLGDIYHSSPVVIGPPRLDIADESYNAFRETAGVADRPTVLYVGTNDGILHAFAVEDWENGAGTETLDEGEEIWGFIPPILLNKLDSAAASHQVMLDGTPVVRDVFYQRTSSDAPNGNIYHTVLIMGFRGGARGYFALDVTDPLNPEFLWQHIGDDLSAGDIQYATGTPALTQLLIGAQERAVAVLPGGEGELASAAGCTGTTVQQTTNTTAVPRALRRCWTSKGRIMTFLDVQSGYILRTETGSTFTSPLDGAVSMYPGDVGTVSQRAFFTDADGVIWSADLTSATPASWTFRPMHDIYWDAAYDAGQPGYGAPVVSANDNGNIVIVQGTGDIDRLDSPAANRVVSITEDVSYDTSGVPTYGSTLNWELRLLAGEQVTGPLELFEGRVYFATFESGSAMADACYIGQSRIWAVDYLQHGGTAPSSHSSAAVLTSYFPQPAFEATSGSGVYDTFYRGPIEDRLVLGVGVTQRPTCVQGTTVADTYLGSRYQVQNTGGGQFVLTAMISGGTVEAAGGGAFELANEVLPTPPSSTTIHQFAGEVDY